MFKSDSTFACTSEVLTHKKIQENRFYSESYTSTEVNELINSISSKTYTEESLPKTTYPTYSLVEEVNSLLNAMSSKSNEKEQVRSYENNYSTWKEYEVFCLIEGSYDSRNFQKETTFKKDKSNFDEIRYSSKKIEAQLKTKEKKKKFSKEEIASLFV